MSLAQQQHKLLWVLLLLAVRRKTFVAPMNFHKTCSGVIESKRANLGSPKHRDFELCCCAAAGFCYALAVFRDHMYNLISFLNELRL
jgi:hypothetical protein